MHARACLRSCLSAAASVAAATLLIVLIPSISSAQIYESVGIRAQGMSGAFVAVADDATSTWWNPAGLATGGFFNAVLEVDRVEDSSHTRARAFSLTVPSLGISYYRLSLSGMQVLSTTGMPPANREDQGVLSQYGVTVGQSLTPHLVLASTLKLVRALDTNSLDVDTGVMAMFGRVRAGLSVRNIKAPQMGEGTEFLKLPRLARAGVALTAGSADSVALTAAFDGDLTTTPTPIGEVRHMAVGAEAWLKGYVGVRGGVGVNTVGATRQSWSAGASLALRSGMFADAQLTRGDDLSRNGWGFGLRFKL